MRYAIIGSGGREHALSWKLAQEVGQENVFTVAGNDGIPNSHTLPLNDGFQSLHAFCTQHQIRNIVAGSEAALVEGLYDYFLGTDIRVFGASKAAAQLEGSKIYAKEFMQRFQVRTADFVTGTVHSEALRQFVEQRAGAVVLKYDGLAAGKGVFVCADTQEAEEALHSIAQQYGAEAAVVAEEKLIGDEISIIALTDGKAARLLLPAQDHKQIFDYDKGANTGGMGAYCPVHWCTPSILADAQKHIIAPTLAGIQAEGYDYCGFLYFGLMITEKGAYNLEYNARLGDPETQVLLPSLRSPLSQLIDACLNGKLAETQIEFQDGYFVGIVKAAKGYPANPEKGQTLHTLAPLQTDTLLFYSGVRREGAQLLTNGGRVFNLVAQAPTLAAAIEKAYSEAEKIQFEGQQLRRDIAQRPRRILPRLAVFISGRGSNLRALYEATQAGGCLYGKAQISLVFSNEPDAAGLAWAQSQGIATLALSHKGRQRADFDAEIVQLLAAYAPLDGILLAGYMRRLSPVLVQAYAGKILNIHPADTRQHQGLNAYEWAWQQKLPQTYITIHEVDEGLDTGRIIAQNAVDLQACTSLEAVEKAGLAVEHEAYPQAVLGWLSWQGYKDGKP